MNETEPTEQLSPIFEGSLDAANKAARYLKTVGIPHEVNIAAGNHPDS